MALRINLRKIRPGYILKPRGKNLKFVYYIRCGLRHFVPSFWLRRHKAELLATLDARTDKEQILDRVNYYNKLTGIRELSGLTHVSDVTNSNGTYNCDAFEFTRYFSPDLLLDKHFGDWTTICETPSIVKTRRQQQQCHPQSRQGPSLCISEGQAHFCLQMGQGCLSRSGLSTASPTLHGKIFRPPSSRLREYGREK